MGQWDINPADDPLPRCSIVIPAKSRLARCALALVAIVAWLPVSIAQDFVWAPDFPVGTPMIDISAQDQNGRLRTFEDLKGENGLLFMASRSFDW